MAQFAALRIEEYWQECVSCGMWFGTTNSYDHERRKTKSTFYCPNGHPQSYTESEADRVRKELAAKQRELEAEQSRVRLERQMRIDAESALQKERESLKRQTKRVNAGVCPHCQRTFKQLAAHMKCKHGL